MGKVLSGIVLAAVTLITAMLFASHAGATPLAATRARFGMEAKMPAIEMIAYSCHRVRRCDPVGCHWARVCHPSCPDPYSCFPLYGAYGPYGGSRYWGAYTYEGWR